MKKMIERVFCVAMVCMMVWFVASWIDIVADNTKPNPYHHDWNAFCLFSDWENSEEAEARHAGVSVEEWQEANSTIRTTHATVTAINHSESLLTLVDEGGDEWVCGVVPGDWCEGDEVIVEYNTMGNDDLYDDEIVGLYKYVW